MSKHRIPTRAAGRRPGSKSRGVVVATLLAFLLPASVHAGYLVINSDEWTFSSHTPGVGFFANPLSATQFINNITNLFTGDQPGNFLAYSNNHGLTGLDLKNAVEAADHTWTVTTGLPFTLATLQQYDAVFLGGLYVNQQVVIDYLQAGGNVYIMAGTGINGVAAEAAAWNTILATAGLQYQSSHSPSGAAGYNGIKGNIAPVGPHPLLAGVQTLYFDNGNSIVDLDLSNTAGEILFAFNGQGMLALGQYGALPPPSQYSPDADQDGVPDGQDKCPNTTIPEGVPTVSLGTNRWALVDGDTIFDTKLPNGQGPKKSFTVADTGGCSCEQIIVLLNLGNGHVKFGCSISAMEDWIRLISSP